MKVLKFGGTSVANAENIQKIKNILSALNEDRFIVVVSALGGITDQLLHALEKASNRDENYLKELEQIEKRHLEVLKILIPPQSQSGIISHVKAELNNLETLLQGAFLIGEFTPRLKDTIVSYGELLSSYLISNYLKNEGLNVALKDGRELIKTDSKFGNAKVNFEQTQKACDSYFQGTTESITLVPGFVASSTTGQNTTLGRGGSDYSAAILAAATDASELQIWTDVNGMYSANPRIVPQAKQIEEITYEEAMELSHFGAKVLYPPTIRPSLSKEIPILIKNTFAPELSGTRIIKKSISTKRTVIGISHIDAISLISIEGPGMVGIPGISKRFFETLSMVGINVIFITQASSEYSICVGISTQNEKEAIEALNDHFANELKNGDLKEIVCENELAIIALVGEQMKHHQGLSGKMFSTLGKNNVNIRAIAQGASERNISAVIDTKDTTKALNALHEAFFEPESKQLNLFIIGVGNVGSKLLSQLRAQQDYLIKKLKLNVRVVALANSKKMTLNERGIDLDHWREDLADGQAADLNLFFDQITQLNLRNSIFIDNTATPTVAATYHQYLEKSISVVTCNKISSSGELSYYQKLKQLSLTYNAPFLFETNVGAGLPILDTLKNLIISGDKIHKIQAVLSGSLNFVFNTFSNDTSFYEVVKKAQELGYTEPDPAIDLSGKDVMRKILILARESGRNLEMSDIISNSFLPQECLEAKNVDDFLESLKKHESHFQNLFAQAKSKGCRLKFVAQLEGEKASVGLQEIAPTHDFYNLDGSDNIVLFYTDRYKNQPLIVKGAGAGADVTASGLFADIIRIGNF